jgi:molybdate/tungstate transport system ATP-binding protein
LLSASQVSGKVYVSVRPEDILVSVKPIESSARNSFQGVISDIADLGAVMRITVDVEQVSFIAAITRRSFFDMELTMGMPIYLTFKTIDVHAF